MVIFSVSVRVSLGRRMGEWELRPRAIALPVAKHKSRQSALRLLPRDTRTARTGSVACWYQDKPGMLETLAERSVVATQLDQA